MNRIIPIKVMVSEDEKTLIEKAAKMSGLPVSSYLRSVALKDAEEKQFKPMDAA